MCFSVLKVSFSVFDKKQAERLWRDTLNGVSRQFYSPAASSIAAQWYSAVAECYLLRKFQGE